MQIKVHTTKTVVCCLSCDILPQLLVLCQLCCTASSTTVLPQPRRNSFDGSATQLTRHKWLRQYNAAQAAHCKDSGMRLSCDVLPQLLVLCQLCCTASAVLYCLRFNSTRNTMYCLSFTVLPQLNGSAFAAQCCLFWLPGGGDSCWLVTHASVRQPNCREPEALPHLHNFPLTHYLYLAGLCSTEIRSLCSTVCIPHSPSEPRSSCNLPIDLRYFVEHVIPAHKDEQQETACF
jgi:hypothetical protein